MEWYTTGPVSCILLSSRAKNLGFLAPKSHFFFLPQHSYTVISLDVLQTQYLINSLWCSHWCPATLKVSFDLARSCESRLSIFSSNGYGKELKPTQDLKYKLSWEFKTATPVWACHCYSQAEHMVWGVGIFFFFFVFLSLCAL